MDSLLAKCPLCGSDGGVYILDICIRQYSSLKVRSEHEVELDWGQDEPDRLDDLFEVRCNDCGEERHDVEVYTE